MLVSSINLGSKNLNGWSRCDIMATGPSEVGHADVIGEQNISQGIILITSYLSSSIVLSI